MPAARYIELCAVEDKQLQEIENNEGLAKKVRLRAKVIRLSHRRMKVTEIAGYVGFVKTDFFLFKEGLYILVFCLISRAP